VALDLTFAFGNRGKIEANVKSAAPGAASALFLARVAHATKHLNSDGFQS
jgi:hypothetical protein